MFSILMRISWLLLLIFLVAEREVFACAVCGTGIEASRKAFIYSTAILSIAPLAMIGGLIYYLFRKNRKHNENQGLDLHQDSDLHAVTLSLNGEDKIESKKD
ncbi:hypothetical protein CCP3SC5AM1_860009 [Gammaproteobacteria bacterium]